MKKYLFFIIIAVSMIVQSCNYNSLVNKQEMVSTVKGYTKHEEATLTAVIEARSKATSITIDPTNMSEADLQKFQNAQTELGQSLGRLMAVAESYPNLKANEQFLELQAQIEGTENRITVARKNFNDAARSYNVSIKSFPTLIYAGWFGFTPKPYF